MTDINTVILVGRLTKDCGADERPFGYLQNGTCHATVSIAVNRSRKDGNGQYVDDANFFDVQIWGKMAESLKPYLLKGTQICVDGSLVQKRWEKDGQKFSKVEVFANSIQLLGSKNEKNSNSSAGGFKPKQNDVPTVSNNYTVGDDFPEDIPF